MRVGVPALKVTLIARTRGLETVPVPDANPSVDSCSLIVAVTAVWF